MANVFTAAQVELIRSKTEYMLSKRMFWFDATGSHSYYEDNVAFTLTFLFTACTRLSNGLDPSSPLNTYAYYCGTF